MNCGFIIVFHNVVLIIELYCYRVYHGKIMYILVLSDMFSILILSILTTLLGSALAFFGLTVQSQAV